MSKPILCVDFDGVIHSYTSGWKGACNIPDPPVKGAFDWLLRASQHWEVNIYSSRTKEPGAVEAMILWFARMGASEALMEALVFPTQKPAANMTIDDRALCFEGDWSAIDPEALLAFKPWNKRQVGATGKFPMPALDEHDEGELRLAVAYDPVNGLVRVEFGKPVAWLALPPAEAMQLGKMLMTKAGAKKIEVTL